MLVECQHSACEHIKDTGITSAAKAGGPLALYRIRLADKWYEKMNQVAVREFEREYSEILDVIEERGGIARVKRELAPNWIQRKRKQRLPVMLRIASEGYQAAGGEAVSGKESLQEMIPQDLMAQRTRPNIEDYLWEIHQIENETTIRQLEKIFEQGRREAWTVGELSAEFEHSVDAIKRGETVARTTTIWANNEGAVRRYQDEGIREKEWLVTEDDLTCPFCLSMDGERIRVAAPFRAAGEEVVGGDESYETTFDVGHPPLHPRCLVGETPVFVPDKRAAFVSTYSGPVVEITLTESRRLTVSPNHMFLAPQGWVSAQLLRQGDKVFDCPGFKRIVPSDPDNNRGPARIDNVVESFAKTMGMASYRVPATAEYLHGDGGFCDSHINVIRPDSFLLNSRKGQFLSEQGFDAGNPGAVSFPPLSDFTLGLKRLGRAADRFMGSRRVSPMFSGRSPLHHDSIGFGLTTDRNVIFNQATADNIAAATAGLRQAIQRLPLSVTMTEILDIQFKTLHDVPLYDVETVSSVYIANGLLSSNCRCTVVPVR